MAKGTSGLVSTGEQIMHYHMNECKMLWLTAAESVESGDVLVLDDSVDAQAKATTTEGEIIPVMVVAEDDPDATQSIVGDDEGWFQAWGRCPVVNLMDAATRGDWLVTSTTSLKAKPVSSASLPATGAFGFALAAGSTPEAFLFGGVYSREAETLTRTITTGTGLIGGGDLTSDRTLSAASPVVFTTRMISTGTGLTGGGDFTADRTFSAASPCVLTPRTITTGTGLIGGGDLSSDRTFSAASPCVLTDRMFTAGSYMAGCGDFSADRYVNLDKSLLDADGIYVPTTRTLTGGTGIAAIGDLSGDRTINIDTTAALVWTGVHSFTASGVGPVVQIVGDTYPVTRNTRITSGTGPIAAFDCLAKTTVDMPDGFGGGITLSVQDNTAGPNYIAGIYSRRQGADDAGALAFNTRDGVDWAERARLDKDGNLVIGATTAHHLLDVQGNIGLAASGYINWGDTDGASGYGFKDNAGTIQVKASGGAWANITTGGGKQSVTKVVSRTSGEGDYYCDGTADNVQIQQAIDAVEAAGGGTVLLREGVYNTAAKLVIDSDGVTLAGVGAKAYEFADTEYGTVIKASGCDGIGASKACELRDFVLTTDTTTKTGIKLDGKYHRVHNVVLTGDVRANDYWAKCIYCEDVNYANFNFVYFYGGTPLTHTRGTGIYLESSNNNYVTSCQFFALDYGIFLPSTAARSEGLVVIGNTFIAIDYAIYVQDTVYLNVTGNIIDQVYIKGIYIAISVGGSEGSIVSNWFGARESAAGANWVCIDMVGNHRVNIVGNQFFGDDGAGYGVKADASSAYHTITGNNFLNLDYGVHLNGDGSVVSGNTFTNMDVNAVYLDSSSNNNIVMGNYLHDALVSDNGTTNTVMLVGKDAAMVRFSGDVQFGNDANFTAFKSGNNTHYQFDTGAMFEWDNATSRINVKIGGDIQAYCDTDGWHNV